MDENNNALRLDTTCNIYAVKTNKNKLNVKIVKYNEDTIYWIEDFKEENKSFSDWRNSGSLKHSEIKEIIYK